MVWRGGVAVLCGCGRGFWGDVAVVVVMDPKRVQTPSQARITVLDAFRHEDGACWLCLRPWGGRMAVLMVAVTNFNDLLKQVVESLVFGGLRISWVLQLG
eukprot:3935417-Amphidinium_carterae.2